MRIYLIMLQFLAVFAVSTPAHASLVVFDSYSGNVGVSTDGWGGLDGMGVISAQAPSGSSVVAAYLYTGTQNSSTIPTTVTLDGSTVSYVNSGILPSPACCNLRSYRADVTSIVKSRIDSGSGVTDFDIAEGTNNSIIDGSALVVVYENPALPRASVGILDGFADVDGDNTAINFSDPLSPSDPDFFAEMALGINFSCCSSNQSSVVEINGQLLTESAGNSDDGENSTSNGSLITVGGFEDNLSDGGDSYANDSEYYDLSAFVSDGDTSISVDTINASRDDNIFLATFYVAGNAGFNAPPPPMDDDDMPPTNPNVIPLPASSLLLIGGLGVLAGMRRRRNKTVSQ